MHTNNSLRIRTKINEDSYVSVNLDHNYETLEVLSLKIDQKEMYRYHVSDYGILVGRVLANNGFGVPNARLSLFIQKKETTSIIKDLLYPYDTTLSKNESGVKYNLLPDRKRDDCHQVVGTFPNKRVVLDDNTMLEIFSTYYKYTTRTNESGDYMFFGVPTGSYTLHMDLDISDCGKLSQRPRDFVYKGYTIEQFENANQFKVDTDLSSLSQIFTQDISVEIKPFWGDSNEMVQIGLSRQDINVAFKFEPTCVFMGSIVSDDQTVGVSTKCVPSKRMGEMSGLTTGQGRIEIIRKKIDNTIEELQIKGTQLIDGNGVWCFQIPMNLDYVMTDEYGNTVPTDNPEKGIPTRCEVRFRLSLDEVNADSIRYHRGKVLIPHNPQKEDEVDYQFGSRTMDCSFKSLMWNNVYTIKSFIPRFQKSQFTISDKFSGIKKVNIHGSNNPMPYNNIRIEMPFMFVLICAFVKLFIKIVGIINSIKRGIMSILGDIADLTFPYSYITNELCPDLENWYFAPNMKTTPLKAKNKRTCRQWENQSVCQTFKEIAADMSSVSINGDDVVYYSLRSVKEEDNVFDSNINNPDFKYRSEGTSVTFCEGETWDDKKIEVLAETINGTEYSKLDSVKGIIKFYQEYIDANETISTEVTIKDFSIKSCYERTDSIPYGPIDINSIDSKNALDNPDGTINLTNNTNYLIQCVEINLAQQYEVIKFDFYNDWINGCVYLPRWARDVKYKKRRKKGNVTIIEKVKGCLNDVNRSGVSRRYAQQCAVMYKDNEGGITYGNCGPKKRCHKKEGLRFIEVLGKYSGIVNETRTSRGDNVYYLKPCEFHPGGNVTFFATDIVMLGTLFDCNEYGLPSTFSSLLSTSYQMPPQLAETNIDDGASSFYSDSSAPTPAEIKTWQCNSKCNKGGKMVTPKVNTKGVQKRTVTSYSDLESIINNIAKSDDEKVKYYRITNGNVIEDVKEEFIYYKYKEDSDSNNWTSITSVINDKGQANVRMFYDECCYRFFVKKDEKHGLNNVLTDITENNGIYQQINITEKTIITSFYRTEDTNSEPFVLEYEDLFPITETSGIDWGYEGVGYIPDTNNNPIENNPSGHFLGLSCFQSETTPKSCINLQRACEIGTSLSTRIDIPVDYENGNVKYLYIAPNGIISKDQITDTTFRSVFATMNQNLLKTKTNSYGYKEYDFTYLLPDSFDGSMKTMSNTSYLKLKDENEEYIKRLQPSKGDVTISEGSTYLKNSEIVSKDYIKFRFGGEPKYINNVPLFKNSFYFYFGLRGGSTALDEFKKQFYAPCSKNVIVEERGTMTLLITKKMEYGKDSTDSGEFQIHPIINGLDYPFTYELHYLDKDNFFQIYEQNEWKKKEIEYLREGDLLLDSDSIDNVYPGNYELVVTDYKGNIISKTFNVGVEYFDCKYDITSVTDFKENFDNSKGNWKTSRLSKKGEIGGYINGDFTTIGDVIGEDGKSINNSGEKLIVPVIRKIDTDELEEVARHIYDNSVKNELWYYFFSTKSKQFCLWGGGTYEIWVRYYEKEDDKYKEKYQYKLETFIVNEYKELTFTLGDKYPIISSVLNDLNEKYGEWWEISDENRFKNIDDEKTNFFLYKNLVCENNFNNDASFQIKFKTEKELCCFKQEENDENGLSNKYEIGSDNNINVKFLYGDEIENGITRTPIYINSFEVTPDGNQFSTLKMNNIDIQSGRVVKKDEYEYETFKNYINRFNGNTEICILFDGTNKYMVEVKVLSSLIIVNDYANKSLVSMKNCSLAVLNSILPIRRSKNFDYLINVTKGSFAGINRQVMSTSQCFNNKFVVEKFNFSKNRVYFEYAESAEKLYVSDPSYAIFSMSLQTNKNFSNKGKIEDEKFVSYYDNSENILTSDDFINTDYDINVIYLIVDKDEKLENLFQMTESKYENKNISSSTNKKFIEKITFNKTSDKKEKIVIINTLYQ